MKKINNPVSFFVETYGAVRYPVTKVSYVILAPSRNPEMKVSELLRLYINFKNIKKH